MHLTALREAALAARFGLGVALAVFAGCSTTPRTVPEPLDTGRLEIISADVGNGLCLLVKCPNGNMVLNDCGTLQSEGARQPAIDMMKAQIHGMRRGKDLYVVVSHADKDHISMVGSVVDDYAIKNYLKAYYLNVEARPTTLSAWMDKVEKMKQLLPTILGKTTQGITRFPGLVCTRDFLLANDVGQNKNDQSTVVLYQYGDAHVITTGDAEEETLQFLVARRTTAIRNSTLVIAPHHGSANNTNSEPWIKTSKPKFVFFSAGTNGQYGHPRCKVVERYQKHEQQHVNEHDITCYTGQYAPEKRKSKTGGFNTADSGALVFRVDDKGKVQMQTCPGNDLDPKNCKSQYDGKPTGRGSESFSRRTTSND